MRDYSMYDSEDKALAFAQMKEPGLSGTLFMAAIAAVAGAVMGFVTLVCLVGDALVGNPRRG